ncbi:DUF2218 domain-containing protein [Caulobacter sp. NIBR2454]|uniref:DUF2218 domain-containing protein n=1 Tax=Caulobacter sp. NIBR2454 TaxID=3015996 RepID=UPI0022B7034E|nr:DUF2218 domain-containing protein [Caulobacter sp. NIBR2454]
MESNATVATENGSKYLTQLCKHWSHKFEVSFDAVLGRIVLPLGVCTLTATPAALSVRLEAAEGADLSRFEDVVAEHVNRFAHREGALTFPWVRS